MNVFHILNGDALKSQLPANTLLGEVIVARECLVDGDVSGNTLNEIIQSRITSMHEMYDVSENEYVQQTVPELKKIENIDEGEVNLWFEDDLFCQVNLWFVCHILHEKPVNIYLVRPTGSLQYGFAGHKPEQLSELLKNRTLLSKDHIIQFSQLWKAYQSNDQDRLLEISQKLGQSFSFVVEATKAHLQRLPYGDGLPEQSLFEIMDELNTQDFGPVFQEFTKRHPIYGFGDLQVKRLFDQLMKK